MKCPNCSKRMSSEELTCPYCGKDRDIPSKPDFTHFNNAFQIMGELEKLLDKYLGSETGRKYLEYPTKKNASSLLGAIRDYQEKYPDWYNFYTQMHVSDLYVILNDFQNALTNHPRKLPGGEIKWTLGTNWILNLKVFLGNKCNSEDILGLFHGKLTKFGIQHLDMIIESLDNLLLSYEIEYNNDLLTYISNKYSDFQNETYQLFRGTFYLIEFNRPIFEFQEISEFCEISNKLIRNAENIVRDEMDIPHVGEGWIAETELYYLVKKWLPQYQVIHHARPTWLGRQHLDIFIPELSIAIEYQGKQHYNPVEFFGGEEAFEKTRKRDKRKKGFCTRNGVTLIYAHEGYNFDELKNEFETILKQRKSTK